MIKDHFPIIKCKFKLHPIELKYFFQNQIIKSFTCKNSKHFPIHTERVILLYQTKQIASFGYIFNTIRFNRLVVHLNVIVYQEFARAKL